MAICRMDRNEHRPVPRSKSCFEGKEYIKKRNQFTRHPPPLRWHLTLNLYIRLCVCVCAWVYIGLHIASNRMKWNCKVRNIIITNSFEMWKQLPPQHTELSSTTLPANMNKIAHLLYFIRALASCLCVAVILVSFIFFLYYFIPFILCTVGVGLTVGGCICLCVRVCACVYLYAFVCAFRASCCCCCCCWC